MEKTIINQEDKGFNKFMVSTFNAIRERELDRGSEWELTLKKYQTVWLKHLPQLPVTAPQELTMVRINPELPWREDNVKVDYIHRAVVHRLRALMRG